MARIIAARLPPAARGAGRVPVNAAFIAFVRAGFQKDKTCKLRFTNYILRITFYELRFKN
jgi:hypothetical protein